MKVGGRRRGAQPRPGQRRARGGAASGPQRYAWSIPDSRVIPVYVFSLARARWGGGALRFRDGGLVHAADDAVVVLAPLEAEEGSEAGEGAEAEAAEAGAAAAGVPFSDGRSGVPPRRSVTLSVLAGLGQTVGGLVPPHRTWGGGAHYLWAMGHHPFAPFGHTPAFSKVRRACPQPAARPRALAPLIAPGLRSRAPPAPRAHRSAKPRHGSHRLRAGAPGRRHERDRGLCGGVWSVRSRRPQLQGGAVARLRVTRWARPRGAVTQADHDPEPVGLPARGR